jgi:peptidoglycan/LPS O-acetylase OafA/YrhL
MSALRRSPQLDAVRAVGVLLIVAYHTAYRFPPADIFGSGLRVVGFLGVDLFFALSGFLVGTILSDARARLDVKGFFRKRFFRIFPILAVAVLVFAAVDTLLYGGQRVTLLWKALLFLTGYLLPFQGEESVPYTITWSLSVEVTAYLLMGLLAWGSWRSFKWVLVLVVVASPLLRLWLAFCHDWGEASLAVFPPVRLDAVALGALAALGVFSRLTAFSHAALVYGIVCIGVIFAFRFAVWYPPFIGTLGYSIFGLTAALWVASLARSTHSGGSLTSALAAIGQVSYFIYLFHMFVVEFLLIVDRQVGGYLGFWSVLALTTTLTYIAGVVSWRLFEQPLIRYGRRRGS